MRQDNVVAFENPAPSLVHDQLTDFLRASAQKMLNVAIEAEVDAFVQAHHAQRLTQGHQRIVRNGFQPERSIQTGIGAVKVKLPRVRDREPTAEKIHFHSQLIPKYMRRTVTLDVLLPLMYLKGISTNEFANVMEPVLGATAHSISPNVISRLKADWLVDYQQ